MNTDITAALTAAGGGCDGDSKTSLKGPRCAHLTGLFLPLGNYQKTEDSRALRGQILQ